MAGLRIKKRDGAYETFDASKIKNALIKSSEETGEFGDKEAEDLTNTVVERIDKLDELTVENVQDLVENVLLNSKYKATAKAYIIYRELRKRDREPNIFRRRVNLKQRSEEHTSERQSRGHIVCSRWNE